MPDLTLTDVAQTLGERPARLDAAEAISAIQRALSYAVPVGTAASPASEAIRFRASSDLAFHTADVAALRLVTDHDGVARIELTTAFLGLLGSSSPLPSYYTELVMRDEDHGILRDFFDLFHHRLLSLYHRAATRYRLAPGDFDLVADLAGLPTDGAISTDAFIGGVGLLVPQPASAANLEFVITRWFSKPDAPVPVNVDQCQATWAELATGEQCRLGRANSGLGGDCMVGSRVLTRTTAFAVRIGPVDIATWRRFLPQGDARAELAAVIRPFNHQRLDAQVEICIDALDLPPAPLGSSNSPEAGLGSGVALGGRSTEPCRMRFVLT